MTSPLYKGISQIIYLFNVLEKQNQANPYKIQSSEHISFLIFPRKEPIFNEVYL